MAPSLTASDDTIISRLGAISLRACCFCLPFTPLILIHSGSDIIVRNDIYFFTNAILERVGKFQKKNLDTGSKSEFS